MKNCFKKHLSIFPFVDFKAICREIWYRKNANFLTFEGFNNWEKISKKDLSSQLQCVCIANPLSSIQMRVESDKKSEKTFCNLKAVNNAKKHDINSFVFAIDER